MYSNKKMMSAAAAYILGLSPNVKIKGTPSEIKVFSEVLESSRDVYSLLSNNSTAITLSEALAVKSEKATAFTKAFGHHWPF